MKRVLSGSCLGRVVGCGLLLLVLVFAGSVVVTWVASNQREVATQAPMPTWTPMAEPEPVGVDAGQPGGGSSGVSSGNVGVLGAAVTPAGAGNGTVAAAIDIGASSTPFVVSVSGTPYVVNAFVMTQTQMAGVLPSMIAMTRMALHADATKMALDRPTVIAAYQATLSAVRTRTASGQH